MCNLIKANSNFSMNIKFKHEQVFETKSWIITFACQLTIYLNTNQ